MHYVAKALAEHAPTLGRHPMLAEVISLLGIDNHHATTYYPVAEFYLTKHADRWQAEILEKAALLAYANDELETLVYGEYTEVRALVASSPQLATLDQFLETVFGESEHADPQAPCPI